MFDIEICEPKRVLWIRFRGELAEADFARLDGLGRGAHAGPPYDVVFDMTAVEEIHLATDFVARRGELPQAFSDRARIYVVPQDDLKLLVRRYAAHQTSQGWHPPLIVQRVEEALEKLGVGTSDFRLVQAGENFVLT